MKTEAVAAAGPVDPSGEATVEAPQPLIQLMARCPAPCQGQGIGQHQSHGHAAGHPAYGCGQRAGSTHPSGRQHTPSAAHDDVDIHRLPVVATIACARAHAAPHSIHTTITCKDHGAGAWCAKARKPERAAAYPGPARAHSGTHVAATRPPGGQPPAPAQPRHAQQFQSGW